MKRVFLVLLSLLLLISVAGCSKNNLETYRNAIEKSSEIKKGEESHVFKLSNDFNLEGLSAEEIKVLNYYKDIENIVEVTYDEEKDKSITRNYNKFGGIGFDSIVYQDGKKVFIKMPMIGKYFVLSDMLMKWTNEEKLPSINDDTSDKLKNEWINLLREEDVLGRENTILTTEDGEVKATHFSIKLTGNQIKKLMNNSLEILSKDEGLKKKIVINIDGKKEEISIVDKIEEIKKLINKGSIKSFNYDVFIDIDEYIVKEDIELVMEFDPLEPGDIKRQKMSLQSKYWSIEKEQKFEFPELTEENILKEDEIDQGVPFIFEDLFNFEDEEGDE